MAKHDKYCHTPSLRESHARFARGEGQLYGHGYLSSPGAFESEDSESTEFGDDIWDSVAEAFGKTPEPLYFHEERISELEEKVRVLDGEFSSFVRKRRAATKKRFDALLDRWKRERGPKSFIEKLSMHPAYQQIIGLGEDAVPFLLAEFERSPGHYDWALRAITGEDPIPKECRGRLKEMSRLWIQWGKDNGYEW